MASTSFSSSSSSSSLSYFPGVHRHRPRAQRFLHPFSPFKPRRNGYKCDSEHNSSGSSYFSRTDSPTSLYILCLPSIGAPRRSQRFRFWSFRATGAGPPPQPPPETPVEYEDQDHSSGLPEMLSSAQDRVRIFFAVLFWMSLFFWGSAWDGRNDGKKKGPWFRK